MTDLQNTNSAPEDWFEQWEKQRQTNLKNWLKSTTLDPWNKGEKEKALQQVEFILRVDLSLRAQLEEMNPKIMLAWQERQDRRHQAEYLAFQIKALHEDIKKVPGDVATFHLRNILSLLSELEKLDPDKASHYQYIKGPAQERLAELQETPEVEKLKEQVINILKKYAESDQAAVLTQLSLPALLQARITWRGDLNSTQAMDLLETIEQVDAWFKKHWLDIVQWTPEMQKTVDQAWNWLRERQSEADQLKHQADQGRQFANEHQTELNGLTESWANVPLSKLTELAKATHDIYADASMSPSPELQKEMCNTIKTRLNSLLKKHTSKSDRVVLIQAIRALPASVLSCQ